MRNINLIRIFVLASVAILGAAAFVTPMPAGPPTWGNTLVGAASLAYLVSLVLLFLNVKMGSWLFLPSIIISLLGMPYASYPVGTLNAAYDLTMYLAGFFNGAIALLIYRPNDPE
ncbi:MAG: hypothetical protein P8H58_08840 [Luminiphilus sp.]|nr:hypothetical protein [Luminiphilus sp.]